MKTLVVYYSFTRNNELLAKSLQERLNCDIYRIEEKHKRTGLTIMLDLIFRRKPRIRPFPYSASAYDQFVFISPIWAGDVASPLKTFLVQEKRHINRYSFISVCGGAPDQKQKLVKILTGLLEREPVAVQELWINNLLPEEKKNTVKYTSGYRLEPGDIEKFKKEVNEFLSVLTRASQLKQTVV